MDALARRLNGVLGPDVRIRRVVRGAGRLRRPVLGGLASLRLPGRRPTRGRGPADPRPRARLAARRSTSAPMNETGASAPRRARLRRVLPEARGRDDDPHPARPRLGPRGRASRWPPSGRTRSATTWCARWWGACSRSARAAGSRRGPAQVLLARQRDPSVTVVARPRADPGGGRLPGRRRPRPAGGGVPGGARPAVAGACPDTMSGCQEGCGSAAVGGDARKGAQWRSRKRALITGITGQDGGHLDRAAAREGLRGLRPDPRPAQRPPRGGASASSPTCTLIEADLTDQTSLIQAVEQSAARRGLQPRLPSATSGSRSGTRS